MKKLLAIFLAVTMIATFIPSAFAVEGEGETYDGVKMVYDLMSLVNGVDYVAGTNIKSTLNYTTTSGLFRYVRSSATNTSQAMNVVGDEVTASNKITFGGSSGYGYVRLWNAHYVCFEVVVPEDGTYTLATEYLQATRGGTVNIHITPADEFYALTTLSTAKVRDDKVLGEAIGSYNCKGNATNENFTPTLRQNPICFEKTLSAGKYIVTYQSVGAEGTVGTFTLASGTNPKEITNGGVGIKYDIETVMKNYVPAGGSVGIDDMDYNMTNGFFEVMSMSSNGVNIAGNSATPYHFVKLSSNKVINFKIQVPKTGIYILKANHQLAAQGGNVTVKVDGTEAGSYNCYDEELTGVSIGGANANWENTVVAEELSLEAGEHIVTFQMENTASKYASVSTFELIKDGPLGTLTTDMDGFIKVDNTTLAVDETANILGALVCSSDGTVKAQNDDTTVYTSSDKSVVKVEDDGATITAVGAGTADITTTVGDTTAKRTITVLNKEVSGNVSLGVYSDVDGYVTVTVDEEASDVKVDSVPVGSWVRATAKTDDPDYIFRGWKRGSRDNGVWISEGTEIYFPIMTNTFLTAVYEPVAEEEDTVNVEFYNFNGQYLNTAEDIGEKTFTEIKPTETPALTGYSHPFWTLDGVNAVADDTTFQKLTRVVANYRNKDSFDITIGDGITAKISGTDTIAVSDEYEYDTVLILSSEKEGSWYIDGKLVAYGNAYALNVWNDAEITFDEKENNVPIIALDGETKANGARMISYDANGKNIAEVGIIFGENAEITSFESKATAKKRGNSQGQFTAMPYSGDGEDARGYLIYNDNGTYRVIYAD